MSSLVSVITPAYCVEAFIGASVSSVLAQTYEDFELLVVDDASSDATADIVESFAALDGRVRLIRKLRNAGPAEARNTALDASRGRYVAFLDSDDLWLPEKLQVQLAAMAADPDVAVSYTSFRKIDESGALLGPPISIPRQLDYRGLLKNTAIVTSTGIVDRQRTGPFRMKRTFYDDYALWLDLLRRGHKAMGVRKDLARYRVRSGSWSRNKFNSARHVWNTYREVESLGLLDSAWCFAHYGVNALRKHGGAMREETDPDV